MKYRFTQKAKNKKKETIQKLEQNLAEALIYSDECQKTCLDKVHLYDQLLEIRQKKVDITYEEWEAIYSKNGWEKVDPSFRPILKAELKNLWLPYSKGEKVASYLTDTFNISKSISSKQTIKSKAYTIGTFKRASFNLNLLELHDTLYTHEIFLILIGISPDDAEYSDILSWMVFYEIEDNSYEMFYDAFPEWKTIEREFKNRTKGVTVSGRTEKWKELKKNEDEKWLTPSEISTQEFIEWALKIGYIERAVNKYYRNESKAPFETKYSKLLYNELRDKQLISGEFHEKWRWNTNSNSLNYFVKLLWKNSLPREWYSRFPEKTKQPQWDLEDGVMHYFFYNKKTPVRKMRSNGIVDREVDIENVVSTLLDQENDPHGMKYL